VRNGVCIRLFSEEDFAARPPFTQPEIQRANLAEVILRMKAFRLGDVETFPFLNPPAPASIAGGYKLLQELGALDAARELTPLGRDLARLPIDPSLGRMLLQSQREHATRELLIIASGLSIQDPRERPLEQKDTANAAHHRFADPQSDFLTLLNLWNAVHDQWETLRTQNQRRKFCKANFLSYLRMREWQDLHAQLHGALEDLGTVRLNESNAAYEAIHKSILAGLLGHVARRKERNLYTAPGNRQLTVFPGSALYDRGQKLAKGAPDRQAKTHPKPKPLRQPEWIVAGEVVETSQLFARTNAGIDPQWILELAPHLCQVTHRNPHWSAEAGQVLAEEVTTFNNFELRRRHVAYGNINPAEATEIFIRSGLVENALFPEETESRDLDPLTATSSQLLTLAARPAGGRVRFPFLEHNLKVRHKIETWQTRARRHDLPDLDHALFEFYSQHLRNVASIQDLDRALRESGKAGFLFAKEDDLVGGQDLSFDHEAFPDAVRLGGQSVPLAYAYQPGDEQDGVTVRLNPALAQSVPGAAIAWAVPGLREAQIAELLRALPKSIRRQLMPLPPKITDVAKNLQPSGDSLLQDISRYILSHYGVEVPVSAWPPDVLPNHLRPRIEVVGRDQKTVTASRDLKAVREQLEEKKVPPAGDPPEWGRLVARWEKFSLAGWTFGDLPGSVREGAVEAWPGLQVDDQHLHVRLFRNSGQARRSSLAACRRLLERELQKDLAWLEKDLRGLVRLAPLCAGFTDTDKLQETALENLKRHLCTGADLPELKESLFRAAVRQAREQLPGLATRLTDLVEAILKQRAEIVRRLGTAAGKAAAPTRPGLLKDLRQLGAAPAPPPAAPQAGTTAAELAALLPPDFLLRVAFDRLQQFPRYLKALAVRAERAALNPMKDQERARLVQPYRTALEGMQRQAEKAPEALLLVEEFRWLLEEYKVSVFAQELGTTLPVSPKRLDQLLEKIRVSIISAP
jgi:ATP-dependent helicase HrpA